MGDLITGVTSSSQAHHAVYVSTIPSKTERPQYEVEIHLKKIDKKTLGNYISALFLLILNNGYAVYEAEVEDGIMRFIVRANKQHRYSVTKYFREGLGTYKLYVKEHTAYGMRVSVVPFGKQAYEAYISPMELAELQVFFEEGTVITVNYSENGVTRIRSITDTKAD